MQHCKLHNSYVYTLHYTGLPFLQSTVFLFGRPEADKTAIFVKMFDEWFDAVSVYNFSDGQYQLHMAPIVKGIIQYVC